MECGGHMNQESSLLTLYSEVKAKPVKWIWYPYIPVGKITLLQGDPGDGKSTMMMNIISEISRGGILPDGTQIGHPHRAIYQCSEDGAKDTIKPRLESCGAKCMNIAFLDEEVHGGLTLDDERIREAIIEFRPWIIVIDPLQSYIESSSDLMMASKARRLMKRVSLWAAAYDCGVVLIGHLNKSEGSKGLYRGLGSIDVAAAARSILHVEREGDLRIVKQIKNNLAPAGDEIRFQITRENGFQWLENKKTRQDTTEPRMEAPKSKHELTAEVLNELLSGGEVPASEIKELMKQYEIGEKTLQEVKSTLGIKSIRRMRKWYWQMPGSNDEKEVQI